jgi:hypothetical protein
VYFIIFPNDFFWYVQYRITDSLSGFCRFRLIHWVVNNHHTSRKIDGTDFQILWETDLIENMQVSEVIKDAGLLKQFISDNFKTESGKNLAFQKYTGV